MVRPWDNNQTSQFPQAIWQDPVGTLRITWESFTCNPITFVKRIISILIAHIYVLSWWWLVYIYITPAVSLWSWTMGLLADPDAERELSSSCYGIMRAISKCAHLPLAGPRITHRQITSLLLNFAPLPENKEIVSAVRKITGPTALDGKPAQSAACGERFNSKSSAL